MRTKAILTLGVRFRVAIRVSLRGWWLDLGARFRVTVQVRENRILNCWQKIKTRVCDIITPI
jgi:hypothetical protein